MKKPYCAQNNEDCSTCSLVNYGRDCQNNPINKPATLNYTQIYTTVQAAEVLQINVQTLRKWLREGKITATKLSGGDYRLTGQDIQDFLDRGRTM